MSKNEKWSNKLRKKLLKDTNNRIKDIETSSDNRIVMQYILNNILNILSWVIIAYFCYIWWLSIGQPIGCERISVDLCNFCYTPTGAVIG